MTESAELATRSAMEPISPEEQAAVLEQVIMHGDLARLTPPQRIAYYRQICDTLGLNPFTKPFQYISLSGRLTLYPTRDATDQLRRNHGISVTRVERHTDAETGIHSVVVEGADRHGRTDSALGAVAMGSLKGENLANALMKAETKAKRRLTLSLAGLGMFDESEIGGISDAVRVDIDDEGNVIDAGDAIEVRPITEVLSAKLAERKAKREPEPADVSEATEADEEPVAVAPGQEALALEVDTVPPPDPRSSRSPQWTGTMKGDPVEDTITSEDEGIGFEEPTGSHGLKVQLTLETGAAVVALHGTALKRFYDLSPVPGDGTKLRVSGLLRLVPWTKGGQIMPPYRRILARDVELG